MIKVLREAFMITGFVFVMMLIIEYLNVLSRGEWQKKLAANKWGQYLLGSFLGATPGCLGAFAMVAMYAHRMVTAGAVVATMIATSGDESFIMLAMIPKQFLILTGILFVIALVAGVLTDRFLGRQMRVDVDIPQGFEVHGEECKHFSAGVMVTQWKNCSAARGILFAVLVAYLVALLTGQVGPKEWNWVRITVLVVSSIALLIVTTVPDHFLEEHLWKHVARRHALRVFLWVLGTLLVVYLVNLRFPHWQESVRQKAQWHWLALLAACLIGIIPESGPHIIFVKLFADGTIPFSILLASSIVQDGHGMLPMLAYSRKAFIKIKLVNLVVGGIIGAILLAVGY